MVSALFLFLSAAILPATLGSVPVLLWGGNNDVEYPSTSGLKFSTEEFSNMLKEILADESNRNVVVFVQESLSPEDLRFKDADEKSAYPNLENELSGDIPVKYLPAVDKPLDGLNPLSEHGFQISDFDDNKVIASENSRNLLILKLNNSDDVQDRISLLRNHDSFIHETCSKIKEVDKHAICMLTGLRSSWDKPNLIRSRRLLQAIDTPAQLPPTAFKVNNWGLFYTNQPPVLENVKTKDRFNVTFDSSLPATGAMDKLSVTANTAQLNVTPVVTGRIKLVFSFTIPNNTYHWTLDHINVSIPYTSTTPVYMNSTSDVNGWFNYSFHTPSPVSFNGSDYKLTFNSMQIELFNGVNRNSFSIAEDTVGFFTIPIWSGLFVTSLLVTIVLIGLSLIYDIKTMDQFDDPKGKPLTINAAE